MREWTSADKLWPEQNQLLEDFELRRLTAELAPAFTDQLRAEQLPRQILDELPRLYLPLSAWLAQRAEQTTPLFLGVNGSQGSGKSTLCSLLACLLEKGFGLRCAVLSIDDLYLTRAARRLLSDEVHPLLVTRGVPGTHDLPLGLELFQALRRATAETLTPLPRFDKSRDDRVPRADWPVFFGRPDIVLFEGWCVGAVPQQEAALTAPINALEKNEDPQGLWRHYVNHQLESYQQLFLQLDSLLMLKIPHWEMVYRWRRRQEEKLAAKRSGAGVMNAEALQRFIMHYERLTRYQLEEMPLRADLVLALNEQQRVEQITKKAPTL